MAYIEINVDLDEFSTDDLLDEILMRFNRKSNGDKKQIRDFFKAHFFPQSLVTTINDTCKVEYFFENIENISEDELRNIVENKNK